LGFVFSLLFQIIIPFLLSALVVILVMYIAETYGSKTGGIFGTLPSTIVIAFIFIAYNEGNHFASDAAAVVPAELGINVLFLFVFALCVRRSTVLAFFLSFLLWGICSSLLVIYNMENIVISVCIYLCSVLIAFVFLEKIKKIPSVGKVKVPYTFKKIALRGVLAGIVIAIAVFLSNYGSVISGVFSVFPAILFSTMLISVRDHGPVFASGMAKSMLLGLSSVATYAVLVHFTFPIYGFIIGSIIAYACSLCVTFSIFGLRKWIT